MVADREYAESIINTVRESLIAPDQDLRVVSSRSFYDFLGQNCLPLFFWQRMKETS
jgi:hypothetical protein